MSDQEPAEADEPVDLDLHRLARELREALPGIEVSVGDEPPDLSGHRVIEGPPEGHPDDREDWKP